LDASVPRVESSRLKRPEAGCTLLSARPRGRCELIRVSQAEHAQLVDVEREREFPWIHRRFQDDPGEWSRRIHGFERQRQPSAESDHIVIYGGLPMGTTVKISQVLSKFDGENGNYWLTFATVQDGEFKGRRLLLPRAAASVVNWQFLGKCETNWPAVGKPL